MVEPNRVYVVDDDEAVLSSVRALLSQYHYDLQCFLSAEQFLQAASLTQPGCLVTDLQMPDMDGLSLQRVLIEQDSPLSVVVLTGTADVQTAVTLMRSGAITLLEKPYSSTDLIVAIRQALRMSQERHDAKLQRKDVHDRLAKLTSEERRVMEHLLGGAPNKAIASALDIGMRTVDRRRQAVLAKMRVGSIAELAMLLGSMSALPEQAPT